MDERHDNPATAERDGAPSLRAALRGAGCAVDSPCLFRGCEEPQRPAAGGGIDGLCPRHRELLDTGGLPGALARQAVQAFLDLRSAMPAPIRRLPLTARAAELLVESLRIERQRGGAAPLAEAAADRAAAEAARNCRVPGCGRDRWCRGLCSACYTWWMKHRDHPDDRWREIAAVILPHGPSGRKPACPRPPATAIKKETSMSAAPSPKAAPKPAPKAATCSVPGCERPAKYRGVCQQCYNHHHAHGDRTERGRAIAAVIRPPQPTQGRRPPIVRALPVATCPGGPSPIAAAAAAYDAIHPEYGRFSRLAARLHLQCSPLGAGVLLRNPRTGDQVVVMPDGELADVQIPAEVFA
ncbi:MAG: hypothetical protein GX591_14150 [Planctomycetes bacterium]|nr:hypothetical protein [Planctomycetota bacterium]